MNSVERLIGATNWLHLDEPHRRRRSLPLPSPSPAAIQEVSMTNGLKPELFVEDGPSILADRAARARSTRAFFAWQAMDEAQRLALVECALGNAANENFRDGFPIAL